MKFPKSACVGLLLCGCSVVYVDKPIGGEPENIQAEADEWEGSWMGPEGMTMTVQVADGTNGVLKVGYVDAGKGDFKFESLDVFLRSCGTGWTLASILPLSETNRNQYLWCRIKKDDRVIVLWPPDADKFEKLVRGGSLPGAVSNATYSKTVFLGALATNHLELIRSETNGVLFVWDQPLVFLKLSK